MGKIWKVYVHSSPSLLKQPVFWNIMKAITTLIYNYMGIRVALKKRLMLEVDPLILSVTTFSICVSLQ